MKTITMHSADNIGDFCLQNEAYNRASKARKASPSYTVMSYRDIGIHSLCRIDRYIVWTLIQKSTGMFPPFSDR